MFNCINCVYSTYCLLYFISLISERSNESIISWKWAFICFNLVRSAGSIFWSFCLHFSFFIWLLRGHIKMNANIRQSNRDSWTIWLLALYFLVLTFRLTENKKKIENYATPSFHVKNNEQYLLLIVFLIFHDFFNDRHKFFGVIGIESFKFVDCMRCNRTQF